MEAMTMGERRRIVDLFEKGWKTRRIAQAMGRSESGVRRIRQRYRERGHLNPLPRGEGRPPKVGPEDRARLAELVQRQPDATLEELRVRSGLPVSRSTIDRHLLTMRLTLKKK